jgi:hypothetical protein
MKIWLGLLSLILFPVSAFAQEVVPPECRLLPDHKPQADVAYQPGVDVRGKAVVPADINATPMVDTDVIVVPLSIDLAQRINSSVSGLQLEGNLGYLEIGKNGRVTHNGQDWTSQVYVLCGKQEVSPDGQPPEDVIKYEPAESNPPKPAVKPQQPEKPAPAVAPAPKPVEPPPAAPKQGELITGGESSEEGIE